MGGGHRAVAPPVCAAFRRSGRTQREDLWLDKRFYVSEPRRRKEKRDRQRKKRKEFCNKFSFSGRRVLARQNTVRDWDQLQKV